MQQVLYQSQLPHGALKQDRAVLWHMCNKMWKQRKFGNSRYWRGMVRKLPVSVMQKLTTGGDWSHLKRCSECKQPSQLPALEIVEIGLQWETVGLYWDPKHHFQPAGGWKQPSRHWVDRRLAQGAVPRSSESLKPGHSGWL